MFKKILTGAFIILNTINCNSMDTQNINNNMEIDEDNNNEFYESNTSTLFNTLDINNLLNNIDDLQLPMPNIKQEYKNIPEDMYTEEKLYTFIKNLEKKNKYRINNEILNDAIPVFGEKGINKLLTEYINYYANKMNTEINEGQQNLIHINYVSNCFCILHKDKRGLDFLEYLNSQDNVFSYHNIYISVEDVENHDDLFSIYIYTNMNVLIKQLFYTFMNHDNIALSNMLNILYFNSNNSFHNSYVTIFLLNILSGSNLVNRFNYNYSLSNIKYYVFHNSANNISNMLESINKELSKNSISKKRIVWLKTIKSIINNCNMSGSNLFHDKFCEENNDWNIIFSIIKKKDYYNIIKDILLNNNNKQLVVNILNSNIFSYEAKFSILKRFVEVVLKELKKNNVNDSKIQQNDYNDDSKINEIEEQELYFVKSQPNINDNSINENKKIDYYFLNDFLPLLNEESFYFVLKGLYLYSDRYSTDLINSIEHLLVNMMFTKYVNNSYNDNKIMINNRKEFVDELLINTLCDKESTIELFNIMNNDKEGKSKYTEAFANRIIKLIVKNYNSNNTFFPKHVINLKELLYMLNPNIKILFRNKMDQFIVKNTYKKKYEDEIPQLKECFNGISKCMDKKVL